jgi:hypothetical protein
LARAKVRVSRETLPPLAIVAAVKVVEVTATAEADKAKAVAGADAAKVAAGFAKTGPGRLSSLKPRKRRRLSSASPPCRRD